MATPDGLGWGDQVTTELEARANCVSFDLGGRNFMVNRHVAHLFRGFLSDLLATGYRYDTGQLDDWSFAWRTIRGSTAKSMHCGFAIDLDALQNALGSTETSFPPGIGKMAARWGLKWGGEWVGRPDPMHFEVALTPAELERFQLPTVEDDMYDKDAEERLFARIEAAERRTARYVDHGDPAVTGSDDHHERIRSDIAGLRELVSDGLTVKLDLSQASPDQVVALGKAIAAHLEISGHPTMVGTVQLVAETPVP